MTVGFFLSSNTDSTEYTDVITNTNFTNSTNLFGVLHINAYFCKQYEKTNHITGAQRRYFYRLCTDQAHRRLH